MRSPPNDPKTLSLRRRILWGTLAGLAAGAVASVLGVLFPSYEDRTLDLRQRALGRRGPEVEAVALVLVDDESVQSLAAQDPDLRWPWPRELFASMVGFLNNAGARGIVFDGLFADASRIGPADDRALGESLRASGMTVLGTKIGPAAPGASALTGPWAVEVTGWSFAARPDLERLIPAVPEIASGAPALGAVNVLQDGDNTIRKADLLFPLEGKLIPSLSLAAARMHLGGVVLRAEGRELVLRSSAPPGGAASASREIRIPLEPDGRFLLRFYGPEGTFRAYHAADLIRSQANLDEGKSPVVAPEAFKGKLVFIGARLAGMEDIVTAPMSPRFPGVELQATAAANLLSGRFLRRPWPAARAGLTVLAGLLAALAAFLAWRPLRAGAAVGAVYAAWAGGALLAFRTGLVLDLFYPLLAAALAWSGSALAGWLGEGRRKREIAQAFGQYLSPAVLRDVLRSPEKLRLGGEVRTITVFFSDIQGFSTFSEGMSPQELVAFLNLYLGAMTDVIQDHRGVVDKYEGDAIMAFWGAPEDLPEDAAQACLAALRQREALADLNRRFRAEGRPELRVRAGLNRGPAVVGNMGSARRFAYTAMGDTVNLASRLEGANKFFGTFFLISASVRVAAGDAVVTRRLGKVRVIGRGQAVEVHELVGLREEVGPEERRRIVLYEEALGLLERGEREAAAERLRRYLGACPDRAAEKCLELALRSGGGPAWDGVWTLESK